MKKSLIDNVERRNQWATSMAALWDFDAPDHHERCSNCRNAIVQLDAEGGLVTYCQAGEGRKGAMETGRMVRNDSRAYAFRAAKDCPSFRCMTDGCDEHPKQEKPAV